MSAPVQSYPTVDGDDVSWADIRIDLNIPGGEAIKIEKIKSIKTGVSVEKGERRGASGGRVMAFTTGNEKNEASMVLYKGGENQIKRALMAIAPARGNQRVIGNVPFDVRIQWSRIDSDDINERILRGCTYNGNSSDSNDNSTDMETSGDIPLMPLQIVDVIDGIEVVIR